MPIKVARIFNTYGPRMQPNDGRVVSGFIVSALKGEPVTVHGDGKQTRSFCYVDDLVDGLVRMMNTPREVTGPINLGGTSEISMRELADLVIRMTGSESRVVHADAAEDDPRRRQPDITTARNVLGWEPTTPLESGLRKTIDYFERLLGTSA